ncbi:MAG TPA: hypothetical protein VFP69_01670 [Streptomyces sp.]|nr:hypothetical protein [Streptomyces sp.]
MAAHQPVPNGGTVTAVIRVAGCGNAKVACATPKSTHTAQKFSQSHSECLLSEESAEKPAKEPRAGAKGLRVPVGHDAHCPEDTLGTFTLRVHDTEDEAHERCAAGLSSGPVHDRHAETAFGPPARSVTVADEPTSRRADEPTSQRGE